MKRLSDEGKGIPFDTCLQYQAIGGTCSFTGSFPKPPGSCMTCATFHVPCMAIGRYPNATVTEHGTVSGEQGMMNEIMTLGPIRRGVHAVPLLSYSGGVFLHHDLGPPRPAAGAA